MDKFYWERNLFMEIATTENLTVTEISSQNVPIILSCKNNGSNLKIHLPEWTKEEFNSVSKWSACPVMSNANRIEDQMSKDLCKIYTTQKCDGSINPAICPKPVSAFSTEWKTYQTTDGDLIIFSVPKVEPLYTVMFMCYTNDLAGIKPIMFYYANQSIDNLHINAGIEIKAESTNVNVPLTIMTPTTQSVNIYARKAAKNEKVSDIYIYALYKGWPVTLGDWQKNGIPVIKNDYLSFDENILVLSKEIRLDVAGTYTMAITQNNTTVHITVNLNVLSPPEAIPVDCLMSSIYYVDAGKSVTILCTYTGRNLEPKTLTLIPINNVSGLKNKLKNNEFVCVVILTRLDNGQKIYNSLEDLTLNNTMKAKIALDFDNGNQLSINEIISIVVGVVAFLGFLVALVSVVLQNRRTVHQNSNNAGNNNEMNALHLGAQDNHEIEDVSHEDFHSVCSNHEISNEEGSIVDEDGLSSRDRLV